MSVRRSGRRSRVDYLADQILLGVEKMVTAGKNTGLKFRLVVDLRTISDPDGRELYRELRSLIAEATEVAERAEAAARKVIAWENSQLPQL
jgi:hypothetical protein